MAHLEGRSPGSHSVEEISSYIKTELGATAKKRKTIGAQLISMANMANPIIRKVGGVRGRYILI